MRDGVAAWRARARGGERRRAGEQDASRRGNTLPGPGSAIIALEVCVDVEFNSPSELARPCSLTGILNRCSVFWRGKPWRDECASPFHYLFASITASIFTFI